MNLSKGKITWIGIKFVEITNPVISLRFDALPAHRGPVGWLSRSLRVSFPAMKKPVTIMPDLFQHDGNMLVESIH